MDDRRRLIAAPAAEAEQEVQERRRRRTHWVCLREFPSFETGCTTWAPSSSVIAAVQIDVGSASWDTSCSRSASSFLRTYTRRIGPRAVVAVALVVAERGRIGGARRPAQLRRRRLLHRAPGPALHAGASACRSPRRRSSRRAGHSHCRHRRRARRDAELRGPPGAVRRSDRSLTRRPRPVLIRPGRRRAGRCISTTAAEGDDLSRSAWVDPRRAERSASTAAR